MTSLSIVHNNVCSLKPKIDIIAAELSGYDVIGISETHLDSTISNEDIEISGYHKALYGKIEIGMVVVLPSTCPTQFPMLFVMTCFLQI
jgi:hypothetical protein